MRLRRTPSLVVGSSLRSNRTVKPVRSSVRTPSIYKPLGKIKLNQRPRSVGLEECFQDIMNTFRRLLDVPTTVFMLVCVVLLCVTHTADMSDGFLKDLIDQHPDSRVLIFMRDHFKQMLGFLMFTAVITDLPANINRAMVIIASALWCFCLPPFNIYQYACHAMILHAYFRVTKKKSKVVLLVIAAAVFLFGHAYLGTFKHPSLETFKQPSNNTRR